MHSHLPCCDRSHGSVNPLTVGTQNPIFRDGHHLRGCCGIFTNTEKITRTAPPSRRGRQTQGLVQLIKSPALRPGFPMVLADLSAEHAGCVDNTSRRKQPEGDQS
jgi:hypothetical protein